MYLASSSIPGHTKYYKQGIALKYSTYTRVIVVCVCVFVSWVCVCLLCVVAAHHFKISYFLNFLLSLCIIIRLIFSRIIFTARPPVWPGRWLLNRCVVRPENFSQNTPPAVASFIIGGRQRSSAVSLALKNQHHHSVPAGPSLLHCCTVFFLLR